MAKVDLGTKRTCPNCGTKYYDLNKSPAVCPKCGTLFEVTNAKQRPQEIVPPVAVESEEEVAADEAPVETISLEEADEEIAGGKAEGDGEEEEIEVAADDDATFLEEEEDEGDDVTDIIGGVDEDED